MPAPWWVTLGTQRGVSPTTRPALQELLPSVGTSLGSDMALGPLLSLFFVLPSLFFPVSFFFFGCMACKLPGPGIEPAPPGVEAQSLNPWANREVFLVPSSF